MLGVHAFWSRPTLTGTNGHHILKNENFKMYDWELLHFALSALEYRRLNGPIILFTDDIFYDYLKRLDFAKFWDYIDTEKYKKFKKLNIVPENNWTAFKTWLIGEIPSPFLLFDHDNVIHTKIPKPLFDIDVRFAHLELINPYYYPNQDEMDVEGFEFDPLWDWNSHISNTCMLYFNNDEFKNTYSKKALEFEQKNTTTDKRLQSVQYLFADQRLLILMLKRHNIKYGQFSNKIWKPITEPGEERFKPYKNEPFVDEIVFDHTWGHKHTLIEKEEARFAYKKRHLEHISKTHPEHYSQFCDFLNYDPQL